jgi:uncharacterized membrane protein YhaH (DUF805 family)
MDFGTAVNTCLRKYATFEGRATRREFWFFFLFLFIVGLIASVLDRTLFFFMSADPISAITSLALFVPTLAATARRLHDTGKSGWWMLLHLIPVAGTLVLVIFLIQPTQMMDNEFGPVAHPVPKA